MALKKITEEEMNAQGVIAAPDILSGTTAQNKAIFDRMTKQLIAPAVNACVDAVEEVNRQQVIWGEQEADRQQAEQGRETAEAKREEQEAAREAEEAKRQNQEADRVAVEKTRVSEESNRASAETQRGQAELQRQNTEQERKLAEEARAEAERNRAIVEDQRNAAETDRANEEKNRENAEESRVKAEQARVLAEKDREAAENARQQAELAREAEETGYVAQAREAAAQAGQHETNALDSKNAAVDAANAAGGHADRAQTARTGAETAAANAQASQTQAKNSETAAAQSEQTAKEYAESVNPEEIRSQIAAKGDNLEFDPEEGLLYLTSGGERIGDGIKVATYGGGGGGGESNNAVLTLKNTTGWIYKTIAYGAACPVSFEWSSIEDGLATGSGVLKITVAGAVKHTTQIEQGSHTVDVGPYLNAGSSAVKVNVTDTYGNSRSINFNVTAVEMSLTSTFDATVPYTGAIAFPYTPNAAVNKTMHFKVDGTELPTVDVTASGRQQTYTIPAQSHGAHKLDVWFTANVDGEDVESNHLYYTVICTEAGNTTPIIAVDWRTWAVEQFDTLNIPYIVYDPVSLTANVELHSTETGETLERTVDRTKQTWSYRVETAGSVTLTISCVGADTSQATQPVAVVTIGLTVTETKITVEAEKNDLTLHLTSYGRSNSEATRNEWKFGAIETEMTGFNFTSDGWMEDEDGITVLRIGGDARVKIPVKLFAQDFRTTGKTIEIEFASRNVLDYDAILATCWSGGRGIEITAQKAGMKSEKSEVVTNYKEDDHLRLSFVIEKRSGNHLILAYINGIISGMLQYPESDDFSQTEPVDITLGSNDCTMDVYNIRVYENDLNRFQMLDNWIADTQDLGTKKDRYDRNNIFDDYGQILPTTLRPEQKYLTILCPVLPTYKGDKKTCSGEYVDPVNPEKSFSFSGAQIDVQGTSSQYYYVKNFKIKFKGGFSYANGTQSETYAMNENAIPTSEFTFKADVASSEGANNVVLAELYNDLCPVKTPAQEEDPRVRQTIEGHPIVIFHNDGSGPKFIGKYNFNNDKGTPEVFGFKDGDESWEILENGNALVSFKTDDFTNWQTSFEARYPDGSSNITKLQQFVSWVASTDTTGKTDEEKAERLQKFKNEIGNWCSVDDAIFYYLYTLIFLCIDQREKNAFPTWNADMQKWIWLFYDADSSIGTDNKGKLTFEYWMEDIDYTAAGDPVFNGQNNVFWTNLRECFGEEIKAEYRRLRTEIGGDGKVLLSYDRVNDLFTAHQSQWSEAIYNEDAWRKAVEPLEKVNDPQYLPMQQGKKEQHFKHWMYNRFRYLDSKFETGAALDEENRIMMRAHAQGNIFLTSYINMYGQVYFNAAVDEHRMQRDQPYEFKWAAEGAEDAVIGVNSAPMITSLGDLSPLMLEYCNIQYATHLTELKVGDGTEGYVNDNLNSITLGNNTLLKKIDARNCASLKQTVDASGCTNIEEVYFDGSSVTGVTLPNGGILKKLHLPASITDLTLRNQTKLEEFRLEGAANITTLRLENVSDKVDGWTILHQIPANSRVRMIGFDWELDDADAILSLYDHLDTMRGLDENGNNMDTPQMQGTIRIDRLTSAQLAEVQRRYSSITIVYEELVPVYEVKYVGATGEVLYSYSVMSGETAIDPVANNLIDAPTKESDVQYSYTYSGWSPALGVVSENTTYTAQFTATVIPYTITFQNDDGTVLAQYSVNYGETPSYTGSTPTKASTAQYNYTFNGWTPELAPVTGEATYTAKYTATVRTYTVKWYNGSTLLETDSNVPYGTVPTYNGSEPAYTGSGDPTEYKFNGWSPAVGAITGDTTYTAAFKYIAYYYTKIVDRSISGDYTNNSVETIGDYAFYKCSSLTSLTLEAATTTGTYAFEDCTSLATVRCHAMTAFDGGAFADCRQLSTLILHSTTMCTISGSSPLSNTKIASGTGYIYVPRSLVDSYKAASGWSTYASQIRAIEDYPEVTGGEAG